MLSKETDDRVISRIHNRQVEELMFNADIARLQLRPNDIMVVGLDFGNLPASRASEYAAGVAHELKKKIQDNEIIVVRKGTEITVLDTRGEYDEESRTGSTV